MPEELSIQERLLALAPKEDSPVRRALFEQFGPEKYADADYLNLIREALIDIYENGGGTGNGGTMDQDNIDIRKRLSVVDTSTAGILLAINSLAPYEVNEKESVLFVCVNRGNLFGGLTTIKYKMLNHGKGKYGRGYTQLESGDIELIYANIPEESDIEDPSTDTVNFDALTTQTVAEWLSTQITSIRIKPQDLGYTLFKGTISGIATSYLWVGAPGRYGTGYPSAAMTDLQLLAGADAPTLNLTLGTTSQNAYRGDYGEIAYQHTRTAGNPHATQMADIPSLLTWLNDRLIGSRASDAEVQATTAPTTQNKYIDTIRFFNWLSWVKRQAWNFTGDLKKNNVDVATLNDIGGKLNSAANNGLAGSGISVPKVSADGTVSRNPFLTWIELSKELFIGAVNTPGKFTVWSNISRLKVQSNISNGQAYLEFNDNQDNAYSFRSVDGTTFMSFRTLDGREGTVIWQTFIFDQGIFMPVSRSQAAITTTAALSEKVYGKSRLGDDFILPLDVDASTMVVWGMLKVQNLTGNRLIICEFKCVATRVGGVVRVNAASVHILNDYGTSNFSVGLEAVGTTGVRLFFQKGAADATEYAGAFLDINYSV
jgi:hypothetical protein